MIVEVTDHAVVRWLERVEGVPIEKLREEIARAAVPHIEARRRWAPHGSVYLALNGPTVITVVPNKPGKAHR